VADPKEIHVGDFDTEYVVPVYDNDQSKVNFDPSGATVKKLLFRQPGVEALVERVASAMQKTVGGATTWCLVYRVTEADVKTAHEFHQAPGSIKIQILLNYVTGEWKSNIITTDSKGTPLKVMGNLT
jgi:hypothetical protein